MTLSCLPVQMGLPDLLNVHPVNKRKKREPEKKGKKQKERIQPRGGLACFPPLHSRQPRSRLLPPLLPEACPPPDYCPLPTFVAFSFHSCLTASSLGCFHPHSLSTCAHSFLTCGAHALYPAKRRCRVCFLPTVLQSVTNVVSHE